MLLEVNCDYKAKQKKKTLKTSKFNQEMKEIGKSIQCQEEKDTKKI